MINKILMITVLVLYAIAIIIGINLWIEVLKFDWIYVAIWSFAIGKILTLFISEK